MDKPQIFVYQEEQLDFSCFSCCWLPSSSKFSLVGTNARNEGVLRIYQVERNKLACQKHVEVPKNSSRCCTSDFSDDAQRKIAIGCLNGHLEVRDAERLEHCLSDFKAHDDVVNCIDGAGGLGGGKGPSEIVTGSKDGSIKVWDPRQPNEPVIDIENESQNKRDCWAVAFGDCSGDESRMVACGFDSGEIKLFDLASQKVWQTVKMRNGISSLAFDRKCIDRNKLYVGTLEGGVYCVDLSIWHPEQGFGTTLLKDNPLKKTTVWQVKPLPQHRDIAVGSAGDGSISLWQYQSVAKKTCEDDQGREYNLPGTLSQVQRIFVSQQPVSSFDLHKVRQGLGVQCSLDQVVRVLIFTKLDDLF